MIERLFKAFLEFLGVLLIAQMVVGGLLQLLAPAVHRAGNPAQGFHLNAIESVFWAVLVGAFGVGLFVRARIWLRGRDHRAAALRDAEARRARTAVREPAEHVPAYDAGVVPPEDPDPALNDEDDERG